MAMADKIPDPTDKYVGSRVGRELINALGQTTYQGLFAPKATFSDRVEPSASSARSAMP
jgi:hypothetical protein